MFINPALTHPAAQWGVLQLHKLKHHSDNTNYSTLISSELNKSLMFGTATSHRIWQVTQYGATPVGN